MHSFLLIISRSKNTQVLIRVSKFHTESMRSVTASPCLGGLLAYVDLKDAYLPVPIFSAHQRYLYFAVARHYQLIYLPFGLSITVYLE